MRATALKGEVDDFPIGLGLGACESGAGFSRNFFSTHQSSFGMRSDESK
jgi:hypothetical protein